MAGPRIGSLCTGYGGLDDAVQTAFGGEVIWHADSDPGAAAILAHHTPSVPNLGDITQVDWSQVLARHGQIDILGMGFPCQDVSVAGLRAGLLTGNRSGLWHHCARAIAVLQPSLVVIENVPGLLSTTADRGLGSDAPDLDPSTGSRLVLRALGAVLGDLAGLGFDAEWTSVAASDGGGATSADGSSSSPGLPTPRARDWKHGGKDGLHEALQMLPTPRATDGTKGGPNQRGSKGDLMLPSAVAQLLPTPRASDSNGGGSTVTEGSTCGPRSGNLLPTPTANLAVNGGTQHPVKRRAGGHQPSIADVIEHLGASTPPPSTGGSR